MRLIYTILFYFLTPFILLRLYWRGIKAPEYRKRWKERLSIYSSKLPRHVIWIHAVSVGEAEAVFPLVKKLQAKYPTDQFLITTTTPTGSARVKAVLSSSVTHVYLPYDLPCVVKRFVAIFKPKIAIIMEKEIWPNLYVACANNNVPIMIINARLSANSAKGYKKIPALVKPALNAVKWVLTQTEEDRLRFIAIGAKEENVVVSGNLKFDLEVASDLYEQARDIKQQQFSNRFVWLIASTHDQEELMFFNTYLKLKEQIPELLLMVAPRHPERFSEVKQLADKMKLKVAMRSLKQQSTTDTDVYIADTMGELKLLYATADLCFVGGSMVPVGGHNILEPAVLNTPIMFGPYMVNFKEIMVKILDLDAAVQCADMAAVADTVKQLYINHNDRKKMAIRAKQFVDSNQGATNNTVVIIEKLIAINKEHQLVNENE